jgi:hypothetical protein
VNRLKQALFDEFDGFSDKRIKDITASSTFIIDDRKEGDLGANKQLKSYFCQVFAEVRDGDTVEVILRGNLPDSKGVRKRVDEIDGEFTDSEIKFLVTKNELYGLARIGQSIASIVAPGNRYQVASYKYVCPRVAKSLKRLKLTLSSVWTE